ncbi:MAG TPA: cytochrome c [Kofleriaceae bacterium]|nr:cytochrome c [Kofleriaceae bacterium]
MRALSAALPWLPALVACAALAAACDLDLNRMTDQARFSTYEECESCPGGTVMQPPPAGTIPRHHVIAPAEVTRGAGPGGWVRDIPIDVDRALVERGHGRFDIFCAACHGRLGNGLSQVAENMVLRLPPSLVDPPYPAYPAGRIYGAIANGYGLMRSYAAELPVADRWAVVAYVRALQLSQRAALSDLPADLREEAGPWLR